MPVFDQEALRRAESRCTQESPPRCRRDCPLDLDVRAFLAHAARGEWGAARKLLERHLPLPELFCRLCDHPCEEGCARRDLGGSLDVRGLEIFCLEALGPQSKPLPMPRKARRLAVMGAGLAGLTAVWDLAAKGYPVTLLHDQPIAPGLAARFGGEESFSLLWEAQRQALERKGVCFETTVLDEACLHRCGEEYAAVLLDADAAAPLAPVEAALDAATLHWRDNICCAGWLSLSPTGAAWASASRQAGQGRRAARSLERLAGGVSLTAARDESPRELHTRLDGIAPVPRVEPASGRYTEAEAREEAERCLQCQCLICVKQCLLLQKHKGYPRVYARQMFNNAAIVKGLHLANELIAGCTLCGQCEELCPENFSMAELCLTSRRDMVERGYMPPSAHEFALEDMEAACGPACALRIPPDAHPADGATPAVQAAAGAGSWLFFPGCQLAASRGEQVEALFDWLRTALAGTGELAPGLPRGPLGLLLRCCGIPARWAGREADFAAQAAELRQIWEECGKPRVAAACSSCLAVLREVLPEARPLSLWELLDALPWPGEAGRIAEGDTAETTLSIQDPCTARHDAAWQAAVRSLVRKAGHVADEPAYSGARTACCGYGGLVWCAQPELAGEMSARRGEDLAHTALTSCIMCRDRLAASGKAGLHLLDLLPQLAAFSTDPARRGPGLSARRAGRAALRERLLRRFPQCGEAAPDRATHWLPVHIPADVLTALEARHILREDVCEALTRVEREGAYFVNESNGHRLGAWRPRKVTFWVEYRPLADGEGFELLEAWCHRMRVPGVLAAAATTDEGAGCCVPAGGELA